MEFLRFLCLSVICLVIFVTIFGVIPALIAARSEKKSVTKSQAHLPIQQAARRLEALGMPDEARAFQEQYWELWNGGNFLEASDLLDQTRRMLDEREDWEGGIVDSLFPD